MKKSSDQHRERFLNAIIDKLDVDILFECFAGLLIGANELQASDIHVVPYENHRRSYKNDIVTAPLDDPQDQEHFFRENEHGLLIMYTSRTGLLNYLPENFYSNADNKLETHDEHGKKRTVKDRKRYQEEVKAKLESARRFFRPLEVAYNRIRITREVHEVSCLENLDPLLEALWSEFSIRNASWRKFVRTLHLVPFTLGDLEKTRALITYVLDKEVALSYDVEESFEMNEEEQQMFAGEERIMGFNMSIGHTVYDFLEICNLQIQELTTDEFFEFFDQDSDHGKLLKEIKKFYFPLDCDVRLDFTIKLEKRGPEEEAPIPIIGYSSKLGG